jgi:bifunctional non-homologous end joining protein LigD
LVKYLIGLEQEFVIGGYKHPEGATGAIESLLVGYYEGGKLLYAGKVKSGFPEAELLRKFRRMTRPKCPFVNLPSGSSGRWGYGVDAEEMKRCIWVQPKLVCQVSFAEWTRGNQLRHTSLKGMRADKDPKEVVMERTFRPEA